MTHQTRVLISIALAAAAFISFAAALWLRARSDQLANSPVVLRTIQAHEDLDGHYVPEDALLSPAGLRMRRQGNRLLALGAILITLALLNHLTV